MSPNEGSGSSVAVTMPIDIDIGDDHALGWIGVIGAAAQQSASLRDFDQSRQGALAA